MNFKLLKKAISQKSNTIRKRFKGVTKSYVSLFMVVTLVTVGTVAWFTSRDRIGITSPSMEFNTSSGIHDDQMQTLQTEIKIPNFKLEEASSIDGRNIYFPSTMWNNPSDTQSIDVAYRNTSSTSSDTDLIDWSTTNTRMQAQTNAMRFREANAGDKNIHYAWGDADINSAGGETKVWIKGYKIVIGDDVTNEANCNVYHDQIDITYTNNKPTGQKFSTPYSCPVRVAIIDDSGHTPKVFDPSAKIHDYVDKTYAVYSITNDGVPSLRETANLESFASYYYGTDNPLFTIPAGGHINMTVVAWLEGTHPNAKDFIGKQMSLALEVETNVSQMEEVFLHDWTIGDTYEDVNGSVTESNYISAGNFNSSDGVVKCQWLSGDVDIAMSYYDEFAQTYKTTVMTKTSNDSKGRAVYKAAIPSYVTTKISFYRLSTYSDDVYPGTVYNAWHTYSGVSNDLNTKTRNWQVLGTLSANRTIGSSSSCYNHYYAIRGNGNGSISHKQSDRYEKWLDPGIGYWGTASGPVKTGS